ncbi:hypothetical protein BaRGS_00021473, partial [Batillaria attramentaria]
AMFDFPTLNTPVLTAKENETVTLHFTLHTVGCDSLHNFTISVGKTDRDSHLYSRCCVIQWTYGFCVNTPFRTVHCSCMCLPKRGEYRLITIVDRTDNTKWLWTSSEPKKVLQKELTFNVT